MSIRIASGVLHGAAAGATVPLLGGEIVTGFNAKATDRGDISDLLEFVTNAHGGIERWERVRRIEAEVSVTGPPRSVSSIGPSRRVMIRAAAHQQYLEAYLQDGSGRYCTYYTTETSVLDQNGKTLSLRYDPRGRFRSDLGRWDFHKIIYFVSRAIWSGVTLPFSLSRPGVLLEEAEQYSYEQAGQRTVRASFPQLLHTQARSQLLYFGPGGLLHRQEYDLDVMSDMAVEEYASGHEVFDGLVFPTRRIVRSKKDSSSPGRPLMTLTLRNLSLFDAAA